MPESWTLCCSRASSKTVTVSPSATPTTRPLSSAALPVSTTRVSTRPANQTELAPTRQGEGDGGRTH